MASKTIYVYKDNSKKFYYKIGKADIRAGFDPSTTSPDEIAKNRINEQRSAGVNSEWSFVYVFDISRVEFSSLEVESYIHKKLNSFNIKINKDLENNKDSTYKTEWFEIPGVDDNKIIELVSKLIKNKTSISAKKSYKLRSYQSHLKNKFLTKYNNGYRSFTLELCPRFGKTIWVLDVFSTLVKKYDFNYLILPSFILSSNTSFKNEIIKYKQLDEFVFVDDKDKNFLSKIKENDKLVIGLSLHNTKEKNIIITDQINLLSKGKKFLVIDEADQGTCTDKKKDKVNQINCDLYADMSGTGISKVLNLKHKNLNTCTLSFSYSEILLAKNKSHPEVEWCPTLENIPVPYMYRLTIPNGNWKNKMMNSLGLDVSWSKLLGNVKANESILQDLLEALFVKNQRNQFNPDKSILTKLSLDNREEFTRCDVCMIFANFRNNTEFKEFIRIAKNCLRNKYEVLQINGEKTTNAEAEKLVRDKIELIKASSKGRRLLIVSKNMASRSFSIPEIDTVFFMYDKGSKDQTSQKGSRANTPGVLLDGTVKKASSLVSLSFDNNRREYDVFDDYIVNEVKRVQEEEESFQDAIKRLHSCWNIFFQDENGNYLKVSEDQYSKSLLNATKTKDIFKSLVDVDELFDMIKQDDILGKVSKSKVALQKDDIDISKVKTTQKLRDYVRKSDDITETKKEEDYKLHLAFLLEHIEELSAFNNFSSNNIYNILDQIIESNNSKEVIKQIEKYFKVKFTFIVKSVLTKNFPTSIINTVIEYKNKNYEKFCW